MNKINELTVWLSKLVSQNPSEAKEASIIIDRFQCEPGFLSLILDLLTSIPLQQGARRNDICYPASIVLKSFVFKNWKERNRAAVAQDYVISPVEKSRLMGDIIPLIITSSEKGRKQYHDVLKKLITYEWPANWPTLTATVISLLTKQGATAQEIRAGCVAAARIWSNMGLNVRMFCRILNGPMNEACSLLPHVARVFAQISQSVLNGGGNDITRSVCEQCAMVLYQASCILPPCLFSESIFMDSYCSIFDSVSCICPICVEDPACDKFMKRIAGSVKSVVQRVTQGVVHRMKYPSVRTASSSTHIASFFFDNPGKLLELSVGRIISVVLSSAAKAAHSGLLFRRMGDLVSPSVALKENLTNTPGVPSGDVVSYIIDILSDLAPLSSHFVSCPIFSQIITSTIQFLFQLGPASLSISLNTVDSTISGDSALVAEIEHKQVSFNSFTESDCGASINGLIEQLLLLKCPLHDVVRHLTQMIVWVISQYTAGGSSNIPVMYATGAVSMCAKCCLDHRASSELRGSLKPLLYQIYGSQEGNPPLIQKMSEYVIQVTKNTCNLTYDTVLVLVLFSRLLSLACEWSGKNRTADMQQTCEESQLAVQITPLCVSLILQRDVHPLLRLTGCVGLQHILEATPIELLESFISPQMGQLLWEVLQIGTQHSTANHAFSQILESAPSATLNFMGPTLQALIQTLESKFIAYWVAVYSKREDESFRIDTLMQTIIQSAATAFISVAQRNPGRLHALAQEYLFPLCQLCFQGAQRTLPSVRLAVSQCVGSKSCDQSDLLSSPSIWLGLADVLDACCQFPRNSIPPGETIDISLAVCRISREVAEASTSLNIFHSIQYPQVSSVRNAVSAALSLQSQQGIAMDHNGAVFQCLDSVLRSFFVLQNEDLHEDTVFIYACQTLLLILLTPSLGSSLRALSNLVYETVRLIYSITDSCTSASDLDLIVWSSAVVLAAYSVCGSCIQDKYVSPSINVLMNFFIDAREAEGDVSECMDSMIGLAFLIYIAQCDEGNPHFNYFVDNARGGNLDCISTITARYIDVEREQESGYPRLFSLPDLELRSELPPLEAITSSIQVKIRS